MVTKSTPVSLYQNAYHTFSIRTGYMGVWYLIINEGGGMGLQTEFLTSPWTLSYMITQNCVKWYKKREKYKVKFLQSWGVKLLPGKVIRECFKVRQRSDRERQINDIAYMWNLKWCKLICKTEIESRCRKQAYGNKGTVGRDKLGDWD